MRRTSVLIADSHRLLRQGLVILLNSDPRFIVVGEAGCGVQAVALAAALRPDVVLLDTHLRQGTETLQRIRQASPATRVLTLAQQPQWSLASSLLQGGAGGYVTRNAPKAELLTALLQVASGDRYVCREVQACLAAPGSEPAATPSSLTRREWEVVAYVCRGASSKEIALALQVAQKTVETHRYHILKKLHLHCTTALIDWVHKQGGLRSPLSGRTKKGQRTAIPAIVLLLSPDLWVNWLQGLQF